MTKEEFHQLCRSHALTPVSDIRAVGWERGYFVAVQYAGKNRVSVSLPTGKDDEKTYLKALNRDLRDRLGKAAGFSWANGVLTFFLNTKKLPDVYGQGVLGVLDVLRGLGFAVPDACPLCGGTGCDCAVPRGAAYVPAHRACLEGSVRGAQAKAEKNAGSYVLGALGALLGAVVGILPSLFTIIALHKIYVLLFMLIPLASCAGYRLCKGKMNYAALVLAIVFSLLGVYLLNFTVQLYYAAEEYGLSIRDVLPKVPSLLGDPEVWAEISGSGDFLKCLVFAALGIVLTWGQISRTNRTDVKDAQGVLASAVPYGRPQAPDAAYDPAAGGTAGDPTSSQE